MKRYFLLFGSLVLLVFLPHEVWGQIEEDNTPHAVWSIAAFGSFQNPVSSSMKGDITSYENALAKSSTPAQYPFGARPYSVAVGIGIEHRFIQSGWSYYLGLSGQNFNAGYGFRNSPGGRFTMGILSSDLGIEYTFGQTYQIWNFYGRLGLVPSIITGSNRSSRGGFNQPFYDSVRFNSVDSRMGMEMEIGERYHFPRLPLGVEASVNYTNINLFGKSYTAPSYTTGALFTPASNSINDGKNPNDPNDSPRVIDYLSLRLGVRYYF